MVTYGIATAPVNGVPFDEAIARIAGAGFRQVELWGDEQHLDHWIARPAGMRRALESMGIAAPSVHSPKAGWNNGAADKATRLASVEATATCFRQAAEIGAQVVICHPNQPIVPFTEEEFEANWARSRDSLAILAERARAVGVRMAVENLPARGDPRPGATIADVLKMIQGLGDHVGICLDAGHSNANGQSAAEEALVAGDKLFALHIQDNDGGGQDQHLVPGRGTTDWNAFLDALDEMAFKGVRTFEVLLGADADTLLQELAMLRREWEARG